MIKAHLVQWNERGAIAELRGEDDCESIVIVKKRNCTDPRKLCMDAAAKLRKLADDFELIASSEKPFHCETHDSIARRQSSA